MSEYLSRYTGPQVDALLEKADASIQGVKVNGSEVSKDVQNKVNLVLTKGSVGLENVNNTSDAQKPVSQAQAAAIAAETSRAQGAEEANASAILGEASRAQEAEGALASAIAAEAERAQAAESGLDAAKQNKIADLGTIRSNASAGKTASDNLGGHTVAKDVPADAKFTDTVYDDTAIKGRVSAIEGKENGWNAKYQKPSDGIPKSDLALGVKTSLNKADSALQPSALNPYRTAANQDTIDNGIKGRLDVIEEKEAGWDAKYNKPSGGIPKSDLASAVQTTLGKADSALQPAALNPYRTSSAQDAIDATKANKDGYYAGLSAGYADKAGDLDIQTSAMVRHTQVKPMETTGGDKDVKDGAGFIRVVKGTENGITAAGAKIISLGFNLIPSGNGTSFTFRCVKGEWGAYGTSAKNNGYLFTDSQGNILVPSSVKQNGVAVPTHTDHGNTYYLPSQDGQCTVVFAASQTNPCAHLCWSNGRDTKDNYEAYNASQVDLASAITAIGGTLRRVGYVFDEINLETKQSIRRIGNCLLNALSWTMEAGPTPEEGEATNTFRAIVSGGVAAADTIKAGGAFAIKGLSGLTFSLDGTSLVCDSTIASVADFVTALGSGTVEYELAVEVVASNSLNGQITISDYGIIIFENTAGASVVDIDFDFDTKWRDFIKNLPNDLEQMNDIEEGLREDIDALTENRDKLGDVHAKSIDLDELPKICHYEAIIKATTAPNVAPDFIGQMWIDTAAGKVYMATATTNASSFKVLN